VAMIGTDLGNSERLFLAGAWIPKATVPAALSSEILERATALNMPQEIIWGREVITIFIFMILVTAPLGAILISVTGPLLLPPGEEGEEQVGDIEKRQTNTYADINYLGNARVGDAKSKNINKNKTSFRDLVV